MARISSPLEGQIININAQTVSRQVISGGRGVDVGGGGGAGTERGGAIVVRPQVSLVDRAQDLQIQQTQQSVSSIQPSLEIIRANIQVLTDGIEKLRRELLIEGQVEQKNLKDEQESEKKLNERQIRLGRESLLERRITKALDAPVRNIQNKTVGLFDRIMNSMTTLFFGWLTNQGIETIKAFTSGNTKKLEEIKISIIKNVLFAIGAFASIKLGFGLVLRTVGALTTKILGLGAKIILSPFRAIGSALTGLFGGGGKTATAAARTAGSAAASGSQKVLSKGGNFLDKFFSGVKNVGKTPGSGSVLRGTGEIASKIFAPIALTVGTYRMAKGDITGGLLSYGSALPLVGLGFAGLDIAREFGFGKGTFFGKKEDQPDTETATKSSNVSSTNTKPEDSTPLAPSSSTAPAPTSSPPVQPQTSSTPKMNELSFSMDTVNKLNSFDNQNQNTQNPTSAFDMKNFEGFSQFSQSSSDVTKKITPAKVQAPPKPTAPVGALPELKPNIILAGGGKDRTQVIPAPQQEPLTDVPLIPSGNTDNFYVLYSQLNYNVVT